jgi:branched-chain amino acid aminotransferase
MPGFYISNGKFLTEQEAAIHPNNRSYRYGDGLFETIRVTKGSMPLWDLHAERLWKGLARLQFQLPKLFTPEMLHEKIISLCRKNRLEHARVRLTVNRGQGGILEPADPIPEYTIESWPLDQQPRFNENGLTIGIFPEGRKAIDPFANLKSNNYLLYVMAALHARNHKWNDALVLNSEGRIADSSIANIFWVKQGEIFTPPLAEAPVNGVMRKHLLSEVKVTQVPMLPTEIEEASEIFLTNAVRGIQWVGSCGAKEFASNQMSLSLYNKIIRPLFS